MFNVGARKPGFSVGVQSLLVESGYDGPIIWDETILTNCFFTEGTIYMNQAAGFDGYNSIGIDVAALDAGTQIKVIMSEDGGTQEFNGVPETIAEVNAYGTGNMTGPVVGSYSNLPEDTEDPIEYIYTIIAGTNTVLFFYTTTGTGTITSVEVV